MAQQHIKNVCTARLPAVSELQSKNCLLVCKLVSHNLPLGFSALVLTHVVLFVLHVCHIRLTMNASYCLGETHYIYISIYYKHPTHNYCENMEIFVGYGITCHQKL